MLQIILSIQRDHEYCGAGSVSIVVRISVCVVPVSLGRCDQPMVNKAHAGILWGSSAR
jgi:hypothetical protein